MPAPNQARSEIPARPPQLDPARFSPAQRRRLSAPGLRTFLAIADLWGLNEDERLLILGFPSRSTYYNWVRAVREHRDFTLDVDLLTRISAVLGIHQALGVLGFRVGDFDREWPVFDLHLGGVEGEAGRGGSRGRRRAGRGPGVRPGGTGRGEGDQRDGGEAAEGMGGADGGHRTSSRKDASSRRTSGIGRPMTVVISPASRVMKGSWASWMP